MTDRGDTVVPESRYIPANLQHSPADMGPFALLMAAAEGPGWLAALGWNLAPVGIGNRVGGTVVALPFWYAFRGTVEEGDRLTPAGLRASRRPARRPGGSPRG